MYPEEEKMHQLEMKASLLEKDVQQIDRVCDKLSESIEKIQEMNDTMIRMITLHEQRHEQHEKAEENLKDDIKELHSRITTVSREIHERIDEIEDKLSQKLDGIRSELATHIKTDPNKISNVLREIDQYKWMILGGVAVIAWFFGHLDIVGKLLK